MRSERLYLGSLLIKVVILSVLICTSVAFSFYILNKYLESIRQSELQKISSEIELNIQQNLLDINARVFYEPIQSIYNIKSFNLHSRKIIHDYPSVLAIELRNSDGKLLQHFSRFSTDLAWTKGLRKSLPPWTLSYFDEAVTIASPKLSAIYSADLSPIFIGPENSGQWLVEEFLPLRSGFGVIVIIFNPEKWFESKKILTLFEKYSQFRFKIETKDHAIIARSDNTDFRNDGENSLVVPIKLNLDEPLYLGMESRSGSGASSHIVDLLEILVVALTALIFLASIFIFKGWREYRLSLALLRSHEQRLLDQSKFVSLAEISTILSHELNQPLASIETYSSASSSLLLQTPLDQPRLFKAMVAIRGEAERINQIVKNIRNYIVANQAQIVQLDPAQLVDSLRAILQMQAERYKSRLVIEIRQGFIVRVDRLMLEQVVLNIARNAYEAMLAIPLEKRLLKIIISSDQEIGSIDFIDTGPGISPEVGAKLFTPFFSTKPESMGIALSMCRSLVERYEGSLGWRNNPQSGAQFTISFRLASLKQQ
jgi:hypothetical protein